MDFLGIKWVVLWHEPLSFLSLIQNIGRCVRKLLDIGEAILFITYAKHLMVLEIERDDEEDSTIETEEAPINVGQDRIAVIDREDLPELEKLKQGKKKRAQSALEA